MTKVKPSSLNVKLREGYSGGGGVEFGLVEASAAEWVNSRREDWGETAVSTVSKD